MKDNIMKKELVYYASVLIFLFAVAGFVQHNKPLMVEAAYDIAKIEDKAVLQVDSEIIIYKAAVGDTVDKIAAEYGVDADLVAVMNGLDSKLPFKAEQTLTIPNEQFVIHTVSLGDSLWRISKEYGVSIQHIVKENALDDESRIEVGQSLLISKPVFLSTGAKVSTLRSSATPVNKARKSTVAYVPRPASRSAAVSTLGLIWPTEGVISSPFGMRNGRAHRGLDIANRTGEPIWAVKSGRVIFAGPRGNYGNAVIIDHGNGYSTLYAHASKVLVDAGDAVTQGQEIARIGSTGRSTGPHLHFEVIEDGERKNPINFLPSRR